MRTLSFSRAHNAAPRRVRPAVMEERSLLPIAAACAVASGMREALSQAFSVPVHLRVFEPAIPSRRAWEAIADGALLYRLRGTRTDVMIVIRPDDALRLAAQAFGESAGEKRPISTIERQVVDRTVAVIAASCTPLCGVVAYPHGGVETSIDGFTAYFEVQMDHPAEMRIGIALSRDCAAEAMPEMEPELLLDLPLEVCARIACPDMEARELLELETGQIVPMTKERRITATLYLAGRPVASGECGVQEGRLAIAIDLPNRERSRETTS